nr:hypothetical protein [Enterococcus sp. BWR-S5]
MFENIKCIFVKPYNFVKNEWGTVYFSLEGEDYDPTNAFTKNVFKFTKKQTEKVNELLNLLDIEVIERENSLSQDFKSSSNCNDHQSIICPNCNSKDVEFMQNNKKSFSVGKAATGAALIGGVGTLAGFAGKKGNNQWHCKQCGNVFETKR